MKFRDNFLQNYLINAPMALAIERSLECDILSQQKFVPPILDMGCGDGLFAYILFDDQIDTGIDPSQDEIERARLLNIYKELIKCTGDRIPKKNGYYNTIFSNSTLEHIPEIKPVLEEAYRLLSPSGKFYVTVPTDMFDKFTVIYQILSFFRLKRLTERYRFFFNKFWEHYHRYGRDAWEKIFKDSGFEIVEAKEYDSKIICLINDFLAPFAFFSFIMKKLFNRWIILKSFRRLCIYPFYFVFMHIIKRYAGSSKGGLIFFSLTKIPKL